MGAIAQTDRRAAGLRKAGFDAAYRHSRRVRSLRRILPFLALAVALLMVLWNLFNPLRLLPLPGSVQGLTLTGSRLTMEHPRMNGHTRDNRPYKVAAERAEQDLTAPTYVDLKGLSAEIVLEGGETAMLAAKNGLVDTKSGTIKLTDTVVVSTSKGDRGTTDAALVSTEDGSINVTQPITLSSPTGEMRAETLLIADRGKAMVFEGAVRGWFVPTAPDEPKPDDPK